MLHSADELCCLVCSAAGRGPTSELRHLIDEGGLVDSVRAGVPALVRAVRGGQPECAEFLLSRGAKPGLRSSNGDSAVFAACDTGCASTVRLLGAVHQEKRGSLIGHKLAVKLLREYSDAEEQVASMVPSGVRTGPSRHTPACAAVTARHYEALDALAECFSDRPLDAECDDGECAMRHCVSRGDVAGLRKLLDLKGSRQWEALQCAVTLGQIEMAEILAPFCVFEQPRRTLLLTLAVESGLAVSIRWAARFFVDEKQGPFLLIRAVHTRQVGCVAAVLDDWGVDVREPFGEMDTTALLAAALVGDKVMCDLLIARGAKPLFANTRGITARSVARCNLAAPAFGLPILQAAAAAGGAAQLR